MSRESRSASAPPLAQDAAQRPALLGPALAAPSVRAAALQPLGSVRPLHQMRLRSIGRVVRVDAVAAGQPAERARQLADIGFVPGESVSVLARAWPGADPLVVAVGQSRFALRRVEAACVLVGEPSPEPVPGSPSQRA